MAKTRVTTVYFCQNCGYESSKWMGQCPGCKQWNTMVEETVHANGRGTSGRNDTSGMGTMNRPQTLSAISMEEEDKFFTHMEEFDRVLGGGIMPGGLVLVGGDPGIGKSTLLLQMCKLLSDDHRKVLYISGEESLKQIKLRAVRIGEFSEAVKLLCETNLEQIENAIINEKPEVVVIDSIQTMFC